MSNAAEKLTITPLVPRDFGLVIHKVQSFNAVVPGYFDKKDLEDTNLWANVANKMRMGDEIRCLADDMSFVAYGVVTFVKGAVAKVKIVSSCPLDKVSASLVDSASDYELKLRGPKKWCIVHKKTGDVVMSEIATKVDAERDLRDYEKVIS